MITVILIYLLVAFVLICAVTIPYVGPPIPTTAVGLLKWGLMWPVRLLNWLGTLVKPPDPPPPPPSKPGTFDGSYPLI